MFQSRFVSSALVALVSVPGFLIGQRLRAGDHNVAMGLLPCLMVVVLLASAIMLRQRE